MTEREDRRRQVELSVVAGSALLLATSWGVVASGGAGAVQAEAPTSRPVASQALPPASGLVPARTARRVVVVRRSRPS